MINHHQHHRDAPHAVKNVETFVIAPVGCVVKHCAVCVTIKKMARDTVFITQVLEESTMIATVSLNDIMILFGCLIAVPSLIIWLVRTQRRWHENLTPQERREIEEHARNPGDW
jgi:hypothetical protein